MVVADHMRSAHHAADMADGGAVCELAARQQTMLRGRTSRHHALSTKQLARRVISVGLRPLSHGLP